MAVYKPSNCEPFLGSIDLTKSQSLVCEINTSNVPVTGYKLRILDNVNNEIFVGASYSPINGLNGSYLTIPLIVTDLNLLTANTILYNNGQWTKLGGDLVENFDNGYVNQPYKWKIEFTQGNVFTDTDPPQSQTPDKKYFDMSITSGQVLGSTPNRIQSALSDEIYKDYFVQLYNDNEMIGKRVRIKSYDRTFGYIYPEEGQYTLNEINQKAQNQEEEEKNTAADSFKIYKNTNDPKYISASSKFDVVSNNSMEGVVFTDLTADIQIVIGTSEDSAIKVRVTLDTAENLIPSSTVDSLAFYLDQEVTIKGDVFILDKDNNPTTDKYIFTNNGAKYTVSSFWLPIAYYSTEGKEGDKFAPGSTLLLAKDNGLTEHPEYNGIFTYVGASFNTKTQNNSTNGYLTFRWQRPAWADSWSDFIGTVWYDSATGVNYEADAEGGKQLGSAPLIFTEEKAVEIYPTYNATKPSEGVLGIDKGKILYNTLTQTYIRPFVGLDNNMRFNYTTTTNNVVTPGYLTITELDTTFWRFTHGASSDPDNPASKLLEPGTPYEITTFFKASDDNPFYAYDTPQVLINVYPGYPAKTGEGVDMPPAYEEGMIPFGKEGNYGPFYAVDDNGIYYLNQRLLDLTGAYIQQQNKSWRNFQWTITDLSINYKVEQETQYNGSIAAHFEGLQDGHIYEVVLTIEDELGFINTDSVIFKISFGSGELTNSGFPLTVYFDCSTQSNDINFARDAVLLPNPCYNNLIIPEARKLLGQLDSDDVSTNNGQLIINNKAYEENPIIYDKASFFNVSEQTINIEGDGTSTNPWIIQDFSIGGPESDGFTIHSEHEALGSTFEGQIFEVEIEMDPVKLGSGLTEYYRTLISVSVPSRIIYNEASNRFSTVLLGNQVILQEYNYLLNSNRYQLLADIIQQKKTSANPEWVERNQSYEIRNFPISIDGQSENNPNWLNITEENSKILFAGVQANNYLPNYLYYLTTAAYNVNIVGKEQITGQDRPPIYWNLVNFGSHRASDAIINTTYNLSIDTYNSNGAIPNQDGQRSIPFPLTMIYPKAQYNFYVKDENHTDTPTGVEEDSAGTDQQFFVQVALGVAAITGVQNSADDNAHANFVVQSEDEYIDYEDSNWINSFGYFAIWYDNILRLSNQALSGQVINVVDVNNVNIWQDGVEMENGVITIKPTSGLDTYPGWQEVAQDYPILYKQVVPTNVDITHVPDIPELSTTRFTFNMYINQYDEVKYPNSIPELTARCWITPNIGGAIDNGTDYEN